ncbi:hypothetical protein PENTCL1PPCAC_14474, partial [Pristionchus entomophagus]
MPITAYAWIHDDPFHTIFVVSTTTLSVVSNGLLLCIIATTSSSNIGSYRYLLAVFALSDIVASLGHATLQPTLHMTSSGFYFFPRYGEIMIGGRSYDTLFCLVFIATYYQTFLVLAYHYVYRLKAVTSSLTRSVTGYWTSKQWTCLGLTIYCLYTSSLVGTCAIAFMPSDETRALVPQEIFDVYGVDLRNPNRGFTVISVRRPNSITGEMMCHAPSIVGLSMLLAMFGGTAGVIVYCISRTISAIRSSDNHLTEKTRKMQMDLFKALLIQTALPLLFSYLPLATILVFPAISRIALGVFGNVLFSSTAIFPSIDALFVLFFIGRFRVAVIRLLRLPFESNSVASDQQPT